MSAKRARARRLVAWMVTATTLLATGCHRGLPKTGSAQYTQFVQAFYVGLAAMEVGNDVRAESELERATQLAPGEPAAWADWGILALRQRNFDPAKQRLDRAHALVPRNSQIDADLGVLESARGNSAEAIAQLQKAVDLDPQNLRALYLLAVEVERQGGPDSEAQFQQLIEKILQAQPQNLAALVELSRIAAKRGDAATLQSAVGRIAAQSSGWPASAQQQMAALQGAAQSAPATAAVRSVFLRNVLMQVPSFRASLAEIKAQPGEEAQPFLTFVRLPSPSSHPAVADMAMRFAPEALGSSRGWSWIGAVSLSDQGTPVVVTANAKTVSVGGGASFTFPGGARGEAPGPEGVLAADFNYDFKTDLVLAGGGGVRFMRQDSPAKFTDVTAQTKLPTEILNGRYTAAWAVDIEADGDLDIVLGAQTGLPVVLRNNGDGTFTVIHPFAGVEGLQQFVWADLDGDGNPDATLVDGEGNLHIFRNERGGNFKEVRSLPQLGTVKAIAAADTRDAGVLDLVVVKSDGAIVRLVNHDGMWSSTEVARVPNAAKALSGTVRLRAADLDNNGAVDLVLARMGAGSNGGGALVWLGQEDGSFVSMDAAAGPAQVFDVADVDGTGHLDLLGLDENGRSAKAVNHGTKNYHWQVIRTRAVTATGDQRINSFGVGGEIQIRSGLLLQAQAIAGPEEHFGLGTWRGTDVARILWPNGAVNAEFQMSADQEVMAQQRLKGSCPFLFVWDGKAMRFVKDTVPWGSAIGLRINALGPARIAATEEWYKIPRDAIAPRDGTYDVRITGELWETYYYDWLELMAVDHPQGTEVFTDERFVVPPVKLGITATERPRAIARAVDDRGKDVTEILRSVDGRYLDTFGHGQYQGVTRDHFVEIDLGQDAPSSGPLWLIARGWVHPSDSSINVALSQGTHEQPKPLSLEVPDGHGGWRVARANLGFPAGRNKICLIDLTGVFGPGAPRRVRLRTNLEVYWDQVQWARGLPQTPMKITQMAPATAELRYRGYSEVRQANASSPEIPDYNRVVSTAQIWRDLQGYYTRYGDVRELLNKIDDRYVIMNAGDELAMRFTEPAPPPAGWVRDFVIAGDGWIKDGDYNSTFSATVEPLPYHARTVYDTAPTRLEDEWVYQQHPDDWMTWQTRYVTAAPFRDALQSGAQ